jgi:hypothetical protein
MPAGRILLIFETAGTARQLTTSEGIMKKRSPLLRGLGSLGIVYAGLFIAANVLFGNQPKTGASARAVTSFYHAHEASQTAGVFVVAVAAIVFVFFLSALQRTLGRTGEGRKWASIVTAGGAVYAGGLLLAGVLTVAVLDAAHHGLSSSAQTLNLLENDDWVPVVAGLSMVVAATGIAALRTGALPRWLGWASIGLGVLAVAGPLGGIAFLLAPVWTLVVGIVLIRSARYETAVEVVDSSSVPMSPASS